MEDTNNITIDIYKNKYEKNNILNENNTECLICYDKINSTIIILINNYCNCFYAALLCEPCFLSWLISYNRCFICRESLQDDDNKIKYYNIINKLLLIKIKEKLEGSSINVIIDINRDSEIDLFKTIKIISKILFILSLSLFAFYMIITMIFKIEFE